MAKPVGSKDNVEENIASLRGEWRRAIFEKNRAIKALNYIEKVTPILLDNIGKANRNIDHRGTRIERKKKKIENKHNLINNLENAWFGLGKWWNSNEIQKLKKSIFELNEGIKGHEEGLAQDKEELSKNENKLKILPGEKEKWLNHKKDFNEKLDNLEVKIVTELNKLPNDKKQEITQEIIEEKKRIHIPNDRKQGEINQQNHQQPINKLIQDGSRKHVEINQKSTNQKNDVGLGRS